jgi:HAD superfamily hydrolase (TIGR01509 family)
VRIGIATTTSRANVEALLCVHLGEQWREGFATIVCGEDVQRKPDPEVYLRALRALGVGALAAVAIEDSPGGVVAARGGDSRRS